MIQNMRLAPDVDLQAIADVTHGYVGADLHNLCKKAAVTCIRERAIGIVDMEEEDVPVELLQAIEVRFLSSLLFFFFFFYHHRLLFITMSFTYRVLYCLYITQYHWEYSYDDIDLLFCLLYLI